MRSAASTADGSQPQSNQRTKKKRVTWTGTNGTVVMARIEYPAAEVDHIGDERHRHAYHGGMSGCEHGLHSNIIDSNSVTGTSADGSGGGGDLGGGGQGGATPSGAAWMARVMGVKHSTLNQPSRGHGLLLAADCRRIGVSRHFQGYSRALLQTAVLRCCSVSSYENLFDGEGGGATWRPTWEREYAVMDDESLDERDGSYAGVAARVAADEAEGICGNEKRTDRGVQWQASLVAATATANVGHGAVTVDETAASSPLPSTSSPSVLRTSPTGNSACSTDCGNTPLSALSPTSPRDVWAAIGKAVTASATKGDVLLRSPGSGPVWTLEIEERAQTIAPPPRMSFAHVYQTATKVPLGSPNQLPHPHPHPHQRHVKTHPDAIDTAPSAAGRAGARGKRPALMQLQENTINTSRSNSR